VASFPDLTFDVKYIHTVVSLRWPWHRPSASKRRRDIACGRLWLRTALKRADSPALRAGADQPWVSWSEYLAHAEAAAGALAAAGVRPGTASR